MTTPDFAQLQPMAEGVATITAQEREARLEKVRGPGGGDGGGVADFFIARNP